MPPPCTTTTTTTTPTGPDEPEYDPRVPITTLRLYSLGDEADSQQQLDWGIVIRKYRRNGEGLWTLQWKEDLH